MRSVLRAYLDTFMCRLSWNPRASASWNLQGLSTRTALTRETSLWDVQFILRVLAMLFNPPVLHLQICRMWHAFSTLSTPAFDSINNIIVGEFATCDGVYTNTSSSCAVLIGAIPLCLTRQVIYLVEIQHIHILQQYIKGDMFQFLMNHPQANTNHADVVH
jgi:hypothetical protein